MPKPALDPALLEKLRLGRKNLEIGPSLAIGDLGLDDFLPDGGLPPGVVEMRSPRGLGGATEVSLRAVRAAQKISPDAWCAWIDPDGTLHAPRVAQLGIDLERLLVVRAPRGRLSSLATRVVDSGAFELVVIDADPIGLTTSTTLSSGLSEVAVRRLAVASERHGTRVVLLSSTQAKRPLPWPVAMRLELSQLSHGTLSVRLTKERHGRMGEARLSLS